MEVLARQLLLLRVSLRLQATPVQSPLTISTRTQTTSTAFVQALMGIVHRSTCVQQGQGMTDLLDGGHQREREHSKEDSKQPRVHCGVLSILPVIMTL